MRAGHPTFASEVGRGRRSRNSRRGSALLAVLWLSLALSAIAFALSRTVRTELERAGQNVASTRAYFLAQGGIEAAILRIGRPGQFTPAFEPGRRFFYFSFPDAQVEVEIIGENGKLGLRSATVEALTSLFVACRLDPAQAAALAAQIVEMRRAGFSGGSSSFSAPGASYLQLEELLRVPGMTPEILYGSYRELNGALVRVGGLQAHLTFEQSPYVNINYASPQILLAAGLPQEAVQAIEQIRRQRLLQPGDPGMDGLGATGSGIALGLGGQASAYTLRSTARLANGTTRTVAAIAKQGVSQQFPLDIVRWYRTAE